MSNDSTTMYLIKSESGYWLAGGYGYTQLQSEAGRFEVEDFAEFNLDGCTLIACQDNHVSCDRDL